ncbi:MAG: PrsW family intramembrane metalloprotease [Chloroflexota bacterium]
MSQTTVFILSCIGALIPAFIYTTLIYSIDRYEKEPIWLLVVTFLWGAIPAVIVSFIFNTVLSIPLYALAGDSGDIWAASFIAPPVEETAKGAILVIILFFRRSEIDSLLDGIIYGAVVGMGFAVVENVYYFLNVFAEGGVEAWSVNIFMRAVIFGLNHSLFTAVIGLGIAWAKMNPTSPLRFVTPFLGYGLGMFLHFLHNFSVSFGNLLCLVALASDWGGVWLLLAIMIWALTQERRWIKEYLKEEVEAGVLTSSQYEVALSGRKRSAHHLQTLSKQGIGGFLKSISFYHRCSELAYKKHHLELYHDEKTANEANELRKYIVESRATFV